MACLHCGAGSPWDENPHPSREEVKHFLSRHGPGRCVSVCLWCQQGIPHHPSVCADRPLPREERRG